jgi:hypothetical protein
MSRFTYTFGSTEEATTAPPSEAQVAKPPQMWDPLEDPRSNRLWKTAQFIAGFWTENRYGPTLREIQQSIGIPSLTTVRDDLVALKASGFITYLPKQARTIVPTDTLLAQTK